jgi:hypothetical protein
MKSSRLAYMTSSLCSQELYGALLLPSLGPTT